MYGMVNQAIKGLVEERYGAEIWRTIHTRAGAPSEFSAMQPYPDEVTYGLVGAACDVLSAPADAILRAFGEYWISDVASRHYGPLLSSTGRDFVDFLRNLDHMHQRIRVTFPEYRPPSFRVKPLEEGVAQVDYYSERQGLMPFVEGLFTGLGGRFNLRVTFEHIPDEVHGLPCKRMLVRYTSA